MVGVDKNKLSDLFKKSTSSEKPAPTTTSGTTAPKAPTGKAGVGSGGLSDTISKAGAEAKVDAFINKREALTEVELKRQREFLHTKTHQDLINAVYKVAEELKVEGGPWPMLRAAGWGHFTDDRGKKYDGPAIDEIEGFEFAQKVALKKVLGIN
jgi:hypothetical protein